MRELLGGAIMFGVIAVSMMIMAGLITMTYSTVFATLPSTGNSALLNATQGYGAGAINTFMSLLGVVALALVGGLAIFYVLTYVGGNQGKV